MFSLVTKGLSLPDNTGIRRSVNVCFNVLPRHQGIVIGRQQTIVCHSTGFNVLPRHQGIVMGKLDTCRSNSFVSMFSLVTKGLSSQEQRSPPSWPSGFNVLPRHQGIVISNLPKSLTVLDRFNVLPRHQGIVIPRCIPAIFALSGFNVLPRHQGIVIRR